MRPLLPFWSPRLPRFRPLALLLAVLALGCSSWDGSKLEPTVVEPGEIDLHVVGNHIENAVGDTVVLRGVNRSGTEYQCTKDFGDGHPHFFDGPSDDASVAAIASWANVNAVRVPLNEHCWLGINGVPVNASARDYRQAILDYVELLHAHGLTPILDLHWVGPGSLPADRLQPMPDRDHAVAFWQSVAATFKPDPKVVLEPFNEPYPNGNSSEKSAWQVFRDGGVRQILGAKRGEASTGEDYVPVGMEELVLAIRGTGAQNLILVGGIQYANNLEHWLDYRPSDPSNNLAAAWHIYDKNPCNTSECWDETVAPVAAEFPLVVSEFGEQDCDSIFVTPLLDWLDDKAASYLAWSWNVYGPCRAAGTMPRGSPWSLVTDYASGAPNGAYAQAYFDHLLSLGP